MPRGWKDVTCLTSDEAGRLYGVHAPTADGAPGQIWVVDVFQHMLESPADGGGQAPLQRLHGVALRQVVATTPPLDFAVTSAAASANGHQLLLLGTSAEDADVPVMALVDLYSAELVDPGAGPVADGGAPAAPRRLRAPLAPVDADFHSRRAGLRLLQAAWHPAAAGHFAALASDGVWRLYAAADPSEPEQSFALRLPGSRRGGGGLGLAPRGGARPVAFAWGPPGGSSGWGALSVLFLASDGGVYALCPVAPFGLRVAATALQRLIASCDAAAAAAAAAASDATAGASTARAWLQAAFPGVVHPTGELLTAGEGFVVQPHLLETSVPALQGPLNAGCESAARGGAGSAPAAAIAVAAASAAARAGGRRLFADLEDGDGEDDYYRPGDDVDGYGADGVTGGVTCCAVVTGMADGRLYTHALDAGALGPLWTEGMPQCAYSARMDVTAVRCECEAVAVAPPGGGGGAEPLDEDDDRDSTAASRPSRRSAAAAAAAGRAAAAANAGPMVLIDLVDLRLRGESAKRSGGGGSEYGGESGWGAEEEEEEEEEFEGPSGNRPRRLRRVALHPCPEQPGSLSAVHDGGAWALGLRWLPKVARQLAAEAAAEAEGFGGSGGAFGGSGDDDGADSSALPAPSLQELLLSDVGVSASAAVGSVLAGAACVLLERSGQLSLARATAAGTAAGGGAGAGGDEVGGVEAAAEGSGGAASGQLADAAAAQAAVQELYAELRGGPRNLPEPPAPAGGADVRTPAGKEYLAAQLAWLQGKYVRYVAAAHSDAINRARQLQYEVKDQLSVAGEVKTLSEAVATKQAALAEKLERLQARHANLLERLKVVALLHWGAPRPLSRAERDFSKQLEVWEEQQREAALAWGGLKGRIDAMVAARRQQEEQRGAGAAAAAASALGGGRSPAAALPRPRVLSASAAVASPQQQGGARRLGGSAAAGVLPEEQMGKLYASLAAQRDAISSGRQRLEMLREDFEAHLAAHPEARLPAALLPMSQALSSLR